MTDLKFTPELVIALAALVSAVVALVAVAVNRSIANKQIRAGFLSERLQRMRDELSRFSGNTSYLLFDSTLQTRDPEALAQQLHGLFLQEASVRVGLNSEDKTQARLARTLKEVLDKLPAAIENDQPAAEEILALLERATLEFHDVRAKEEAKV